MTESVREIFLGRQPILDRQQGLAGYELLFQAPAGPAHPDPARTAELVCAAFGELGLGRALSNCRAFLAVDANFVAAEVIEQLPVTTVVLEITAAELTAESCLVRCQALRAAGYEFCLNGLSGLDAATTEMLALASFLKLDITTLTPDALNALVFELRTTRKPLIANGVATRAQMELCTLIGFDLFEGYYFAQADAVEGRKLNPSVQGIFRMIGQLMADVDMELLEAGFRTDPALVVNLLRLTNSVGVGARMRITSIRHAIAILGRKQLLRWLQLLLFRQGNDSDMGSNPLMQYAALRGRFLELLVERLHTNDETLLDQAFITGLISVLPAALGLPMREILEELATDNDVRLALLHREGQLGKLLALLDAYDNNDSSAVTACLTEYPHAAPGDLAHILSRALEWVQALDQAAN